MPQEYQSTQSRPAALVEDSYSFVEAGYRPIETVRRDSSLPAKLFRYRVLKRAMDVTLVLLATPLLIPMMVVVALLVRLRSPGPIFFSHRRISRNGAFFPMWKFRTMCNQLGRGAGGVSGAASGGAGGVAQDAQAPERSADYGDRSVSAPLQPG